MNGNVFYFTWEVALIEWLQSHLGAIGTALASFFTYFGEEAVLVLIFGLLYWGLDKRAAKLMGTSLLFALVVNPMLKNVALRRRPYFDNPNIKCLKPVTAKADIYDITAQGYSFPSMHSTNAVITYGSLPSVLNNKGFRALAIILPIAVGLSRVVLGVHYPTDVLMGWFTGTVFFFVMPYLYKKAKNENLLRLVIFLISLLGIPFCRTNDYFNGLGMMTGLFLAIPFEEKYVSFKETSNPLICFLRVFGGVGLYFCLNYLLKLPFSNAFLESGTLAALLVRSGRYAITLFILCGVYPMLFGRISLKKHSPNL